MGCPFGRWCPRLKAPAWKTSGPPTAASRSRRRRTCPMRSPCVFRNLEKWVWLKIKELGLRRFWSLVTLNYPRYIKVRFWHMFLSQLEAKHQPKKRVPVECPVLGFDRGGPLGSECKVSCGCSLRLQHLGEDEQIKVTNRCVWPY